MPNRRLIQHFVQKPWGRTDLPHKFNAPHGRIGEIWFEDEDGADLPLLAKYIYTSEALSIQVHPDDSQARSVGALRGKSECWYIIDCEADAKIGIGLKQALDSTAFSASIADGSIAQHIDWKAVHPGDFFYIPAGTIHSIGAGIQLVEVQQNCDITYRLYDYGRPRELHVEQGTAVSHPEPYSRKISNVVIGKARYLLNREEAPFSFEIALLKAGETRDLTDSDAMVWFLPLSGSGTVGDQPWVDGECWVLEGPNKIVAQGSAQIVLATASTIVNPSVAL